MENKVDQLFRENLDQLELKPSAKGWERVNEQIARKRKPVWLWPVRIAAAVIAVLTVTFVVYDPDDHEKQPLISAVDHPEENLKRSIEVPEKIVQINPPIIRDTDSQRVAVNNEEKEKELPEVVKFEEIKTIRVAALSHSELDTDLKPRNLQVSGEKLETERNAHIRITYIASSDQPEPVDDRKDESRLNKVISIAREVSPPDILADIREAKDNLFRRNN